MDDFARTRLGAKPNYRRKCGSGWHTNSQQQHDLIVLAERIQQSQLEAETNLGRLPGYGGIPSFLEHCVVGPRHEAAIALAELRLQQVFAAGVPDTVKDWEGLPVPACFALSAEYLRPVLEAYAGEVLIEEAPDAHRRVWRFKRHPREITDYLLQEYFSPDLFLVNQTRRDRFNSGEYVGGWIRRGEDGKDHLVDADSVKFSIEVVSYAATHENDNIDRWMEARIPQFWESRARLLAGRVAHTDNSDPVEARRIRRNRVILPLLQERHLSPSGWALHLGVDPSVVLDYLRGKSFPRQANAKLMSEDLKIGELPK